MRTPLLMTPVLALALLGAGCAAPASGPAPVTDACTAPAKVTDIGTVAYPKAAAYAHLAGLGELLTAADCGSARFAEVAKGFSYPQRGGLLHLVSGPPEGFLGIIENLGFICAVPHGGDKSRCTEWTIGAAAPALQDLLELKPWADDIASESCASCGG